MKIVIIGAGVAGLSIGWRLAQGGAEVTVLERAGAGRASTWAAAGMIAASAESAEMGTQEAALCARSAGMWPGFAAEIEEQAERKIFYRKDGVLIAATNASEADALKARAPSKFIGAGEARKIAPLLREDIAGALWDENEAQVDNRELGIALAAALRRAGGILSINEAAVRIETENGRAVAARTPFKVHFADAFVLAAGAWTSGIDGLPKDAIPQIVPVKGEMIALAPPSGAQLPRSLLWGNGIYMAPRHDRLFVGATVEEAGFDTSLTGRAREFLFGHAAGLCPALEEWEIADHWAGLRPRAADGLPVIGKTAVENVFMASGQFRNGILLAPVLAESLRAIVMNEPVPPDVSAFSPSRFQS